ncbi:N-terminal acetyltransferase A complex catalytic subunit ard1 [Agyrium rufum]|nr:N-terminal acetyltransferase A complex catalytic subunit ard1 [Agyrium rufum]
MFDIRPLHPSDLPAVQATNVKNLPENYFMKYYLYHALTWPPISFVAVESSSPSQSNKSQTKAPRYGDSRDFSKPTPNKIVGYVLAKMEEEPKDGVPEGHITSISVMRTHRRLGLAEKLMRQSQRALAEIHRARYLSLHVRMSNIAAIRLYKDTLGFKQMKVEAKYYADGEDAYYMKLDLASYREEMDDDDSDEEDEEEDEDGKKDDDGADGEEKDGDGDAAKKGRSESGVNGTGESTAPADGAAKEGGGGKKEREKKKKVKVGRGLGVGDLVERDETKG